MSEAVKVIIEIIAENPPTVLIALGGLFLLVGYTSGNENLVRAGWILIVLGIIVQILWLVFRYGLPSFSVLLPLRHLQSITASVWTTAVKRNDYVYSP